jgi:hypothetical protein
MDDYTPVEGAADSGNSTTDPSPTDGHKAGSADNQTIEETELFKSAIDHYRFVTTMFWEQAGFFLLIQTALLAVVSQSLPKGRAELLPLLAISALGVILALFWAWIARKRFGIIDEWRRNVIRLEGSIDRYYLLYKKSLDKEPLRGPTAVTRFLPYVLAAGWILLFIISFRLPTVRC